VSFQQIASVSRLRPDVRGASPRGVAARWNTACRASIAVWAGLAVLGIAGLAAAENGSPPPVEIGREVPYLGTSLEVLLDAPPDLEVATIASGALDDRFEPQSVPIPSWGMRQPVVWARLALANRDPEPAEAVLVLEYAVVDSVELFRPSAGGGFERLVAGDSVRDSAAIRQHRRPAFPLRVPGDSVLPIWLRIETTASQTLPLHLHTPESFAAADRLDQLLFGLLFGAVALFVVYTGAVAFFLRSRACGWFAVYVSSLGSLVAIREGFVAEWLGEGADPLSSVVNLGTIGLLYFSGAKLLREFLNVARVSRRDDRILAGLQWLAVVWTPLALAGPAFAGVLSLMLMGVGPIFSSLLALRYWIRGVPNARYFAIGWTVAHTNSVVDFLYIAGAIGFSPLIQDLLPVSLGVAVVCFAFGIIEQTYNYQIFAREDPLPCLANRRHFSQHLEIEWSVLERHDDPASVVMIDLDCFKAFNDRYGHLEGDRCLAAVARLLRSATRRRGDLAARFGGEEFVVLLSRTGVDDARRIAEELRAGIEALAIDHEGSEVRSVVTASFGVATATPTEGIVPSELVRRADAALYRAKALGRNRVAVASAGGVDPDAEKEDEGGDAGISQAPSTDAAIRPPVIA